ncbi:MAG TPA: PilZ domain-containing protein [Pseudolabrys sp.]|nr:PilZ domain-containing protein [Pseudolabrys sp.]
MSTILNVNGRYFFKNYFDNRGKRREFSCRMVAISATSLSLIVPVNGRVGAPVCAEFQDFGKFEGTVQELLPQGFSMQIEATDEEREKLTAKIAWCQKYVRYEVQDLRKHRRVIPREPIATVILADGSKHRCFVIDVSASGIAISAEVIPEIGTPLAIGKLVGRVVRHLPSGFAVHFAALQTLGTVEKAIAYTPPEPALHQRVWVD